MGRRSGIERLVAVQADERDLARADEEQLVGRDRVRLFAAEREEPRPRHRALLDHHGRRHQLHAALDERVDRQAENGQLEQRAVAHERVRAPAREAARPVPVDDAERRHELDVVLRREVELARRADAADLDVVLLALADRHLGSRKARDAQHQVLERRCASARRRLELLDVGADLLGLVDELRAVVLARLGDEGGQLVLAGALLLERASSTRGAPCRPPSSSSRSRSSRLFVMAARTCASFWRMNWMSSIARRK